MSHSRPVGQSPATSFSVVPKSLSCKWLSLNKCQFFFNTFLYFYQKHKSPRRFLKFLVLLSTPCCQVKCTSPTLSTTWDTPRVEAPGTAVWTSCATCWTRNTRTSPSTWTPTTPSWGSGLMTVAASGICVGRKEKKSCPVLEKSPVSQLQSSGRDWKKEKKIVMSSLLSLQRRTNRQHDSRLGETERVFVWWVFTLDWFKDYTWICVVMF